MSENDENKVVDILGARSKDKKHTNEQAQEIVHCSFCGRPNTQVVKMVQGPGASICSECTMIAVQYLILEDRVPSSDLQKVLDAFWAGNKK